MTARFAFYAVDPDGRIHKKAEVPGTDASSAILAALTFLGTVLAVDPAGSPWAVMELRLVDYDADAVILTMPAPDAPREPMPPPRGERHLRAVK